MTVLAASTKCGIAVKEANRRLARDVLSVLDRTTRRGISKREQDGDRLRRR